MSSAVEREAVMVVVVGKDPTRGAPPWARGVATGAGYVGGSPWDLGTTGWMVLCRGESLGVCWCWCWIGMGLLGLLGLALFVVPVTGVWGADVVVVVLLLMVGLGGVCGAVPSAGGGGGGNFSLFRPCCFLRKPCRVGGAWYFVCPLGWGFS